MKLGTKPNKFFRLILLAFFIVAAFIATLYFAQFVSTNGAAQDIVSQFGFLGIVVLSIIGGLNLVVPIPAATLVPIFLESGFTFFTIITALIIGTTIADSIGYAIGRFSKEATQDRYPRIHEKVDLFCEKYTHLIIPGVFLYSAFVPFPNEAVLVPLGLAGFRFRYLLAPLILGTAINQTILAYGFSSIFKMLF